MKTETTSKHWSPNVVIDFGTEQPTAFNRESLESEIAAVLSKRKPRPSLPRRIWQWLIR